MLDLITRVTQERRARRAAILRSYRAGIVEFRTSRGQHAAVTRNAGGGWRATLYDERGLAGHWPRPRLVQLLRELADEGYVLPAPGTLDVLGLR